MDYDKTIKEISEEFDNNIIPSLSDYVRIDNLSPNYDPEWETNFKIEKAGYHLLVWALNQGVKGMKGELIKEPGRTPMVYLEVPPQGSDKTLLLYGHFDKQPHLGEWAEGLGPTKPVIKDGNLYGRGASDDGYSTYTCVSAIKAIQSQGGKHGKIVITIEGGEESGSPDLIYYLKKISDKIGTPDLMVCMDSGCKDYNALWMTTSLRGVCILDLTVECLDESVHSGSGSGIAPDSFTIMRILLDRLQDAKTGKTLVPIDVEIPSYRVEDAKKLSEYMKEKCVSDIVKLSPGVKPLSDDYAEIILNNTWRSTVVVTGMSEFPPAETAGNVLRAKTKCRISVRLPPSFDCKKSEAVLKETLEKDPPYNAKVTCQILASGNGWAAKDLCEPLKKSLNESSKKMFGKEFYNCGEGGSIPFIAELGELFPKCEMLVTGVLGPGSNAHCLNECLNIQFTKNITVALAHAINDYCSA